jgi:hypothetical protein
MFFAIDALINVFLVWIKLRIVWYVEEIDKELQIVFVKRGFLMMANLNIVRGVILNVKNVINLINV